MLSADHLLIKYNMATQHDLGTGCHTAFCAAEPCWASDMAIIQPFKQERRNGGVGKRRKEIKKDQESRPNGSVDRDVKERESGLRKRRAAGRRWRSLCYVELLYKQSICYYCPCKQKGKKNNSQSELCPLTEPQSATLLLGVVRHTLPTRILTPTRALQLPSGTLAL